MATGRPDISAGISAMRSHQRDAGLERDEEGNPLARRRLFTLSQRAHDVLSRNAQVGRKRDAYGLMMDARGELGSRGVGRGRRLWARQLDIRWVRGFRSRRCTGNLETSILARVARGVGRAHLQASPTVAPQVCGPSPTRILVPAGTARLAVPDVARLRPARLVAGTGSALVRRRDHDRRGIAQRPEITVIVSECSARRQGRRQRGAQTRTPHRLQPGWRQARSGKAR